MEKAGTSVTSKDDEETWRGNTRFPGGGEGAMGVCGITEEAEEHGLLLMDLQDAEMKKTENDGSTKYGDQI